MADKRKRHARMIQELTGRSYQSAINLMNQWKAEGKDLDVEMLALANAPQAGPSGAER